MNAAPAESCVFHQSRVYQRLILMISILHLRQLTKTIPSLHHPLSFLLVFGYHRNTTHQIRKTNFLIGI